MVRNILLSLLLTLLVACGNKSQSTGESGFEWVDSAQYKGVDSLGVDSLGIDTVEADDENLIEIPPPPKEYEVTASDINEEYEDKMQNYDPTSDDE